MNKRKIKGFIKTLIIAVSMIVIVIGSIVSSLSILKDEAIKTHLKIAQIEANTLSSQIEQTFSTVEFVISNLKDFLKINDDEANLKTHFNEILRSTPYIRSINILNKDKNVIYSSNYLNTNLSLNDNDFFPKPLFDKSILRFGNPWIGRDFISAVEVTKADTVNKNESSFLPILKMVNIKEKTYFILININTTYFLNKNQKILSNQNLNFNIYRLDGILLFSSKNSNKIGTKIKDSILFEESIKKDKASGIELVDNVKYMSAYQPTNIYPLNIDIQLDFKKTLAEWEKKRENIVTIISLLISFCVILVIALIYKNNLEKEREIAFQRKELADKKRFQILFEQDIFLAITLKSDGTINQINNLVLQFLDLSKDEVLNKRIWELPCWNKEDKEWLEKEVLSYKKNTKQERILYPRNKENQVKVFDFKLTSIELSENIELVALAIDITQKIEKEEKLQHAYVVFQNAHDGIVITDKNGKIITVNRSFINSTGYSFEETVGQNPKILNSGIHDKKFYADMWNSILKKGFWEGELLNKRKDNSLYNERLTINAVYDENQEIKNFIGMFSDITKQKQQEKALKEQEQILYQQSKLAAMGEMIENIAHQWRQPLSIISSAVTGMQLQKELNLNDDPEDEIKNLVLINQSAQYLSKTIDDFRNFLKTDKIKANVHIEDTIEKALDLLSSKLRNRSISIIRNLESIEVLGIENELLQVIMNIISNSKDALEDKKVENKMIFIDAFAENHDAVILIKDNAGGINEEIINRVFEPYFTTKHKSQGTGIGLYMSEEIIKNHMEGTISCTNTNYTYESKDYSGAMFKITIPLS
ncbi:MAG: PAS domain S-box protein [Arcobacter sp.]|uniref:PAS domain S-box protein n=1 Tax=Arcobacter sp. TaxID=1872629 RepID=UPI003AFF81D5